MRTMHLERRMHACMRKKNYYCTVVLQWSRKEERIWTYRDELCAAYHGVVETDVLLKPTERNKRIIIVN